MPRVIELNKPRIRRREIGIVITHDGARPFWILDEANLIGFDFPMNPTRERNLAALIKPRPRRIKSERRAMRRPQHAAAQPNANVTRQTPMSKRRLPNALKLLALRIRRANCRKEFIGFQSNLIKPRADSAALLINLVNGAAFHPPSRRAGIYLIILRRARRAGARSQVSPFSVGAQGYQLSGTVGNTFFNCGQPQSPASRTQRSRQFASPTAAAE